MTCDLPTRRWFARSDDVEYDRYHITETLAPADQAAVAEAVRDAAQQGLGRLSDRRRHAGKGTVPLPERPEGCFAQMGTVPVSRGRASAFRWPSSTA